MKKLLLLAFIISNFCHAQTLEGNWKGELKFQGTTFPTLFHIQKTDSGYSATMDSPNQNAFDILMDEVDFQEDQLTIKHTAAQLVYEAKIINDTLLEGTFKQAGFNIPLNLIKDSTEVKKPNRPQTPQPPFPYRVEEVSFRNEDDQIELAGTLTLPEGKGKSPAVILISGSGPQNRDEELFQHKPFLVLADYLTRNGIAVLRYDDRGTASSQGDFATATTYDFTKDAEAAIAYLKNRKEITAEKVGAIGHSEGGAIAPMLATKIDPDFMVLLAGPGLRGDKLLNLQRQKLEASMGADSSVIQQRQDLFREVYDVILDSTLASSETKSQTFEVFKKHWGEYMTYAKLEEINAQHNTPWIKTFIRLDPAKYLENVNCPVLAINGEKDLQVPAKENLAAIQESVDASGSSLTVKAYPKLNHLFQEAETGGVEEYGKIEQTISPEVLIDITQWIIKQTK